MAILISLNILFKKHITMKKLIFSFIAVATAILVSCNEEFEEVTTIDIPNYRDGVYSGDNLTFTVDGEPRTVNSVTISSRQVGNDTLYSDNLKKHYLSPIYVTNVIIKGFHPPKNSSIACFLADKTKIADNQKIISYSVYPRSDSNRQGCYTTRT